MLENARFTLFIAAALAAAPAGAQDRAPAPREVEVSLQLPRTGDGRIDTRALEAEVRREIGAGATEIRFRDDFSQQDARRLLLDGRVLRELGAALPDDGVERDIRLRGEVDARIQRDEEGGLRARIENIDLADLTSEQRAELARRLAGQGGLERVRIEFREGRGITSNEGGRGEAVRADNSARGSGRAERQERPERAARSGGSGRLGRRPHPARLSVRRWAKLELKP